MQDVIIADTSCLILLTKIDELHLLQSLYEQITITSVIADEYGTALPKWIIIQDATNKLSPDIVSANVDPGEASAINLAIEHQNSLLIIDDLKARKLAQKLNIDYTGTIGILLQAKVEGHINSIKHILTKIKATNFRISEDLEQKILKLSGEIE
jgi:predicted nucleic acid-binding protein